MGKRIDLTGKKFNRLTVESAAPSHIKPSGQKVAMWNCICECGNRTVVSSNALKLGTTKSCGCYAKEIHKRGVDVTGHRFNNLVAIKRMYNMTDKSGNSAMWKFKCDCGNEVIYPLGKVRSGDNKSCGCMRHKPHNRPELSGKRFGKLTVVESIRLEGKALWKCICDCGTECFALTSQLTSGGKKSCGCGCARFNRDRYKYTNGVDAPKGMHWIFLDGDKNNFKKENVLFLDSRAYATAVHNHWLDISDQEILKTAMDICLLKSCITKSSQMI